MSKAEKFISEYTKNCSNVVVYSGMSERGEFRYHEWLTPDQARRAVEIAREEIYEWLKDNIHMYNGECEGDRKAIIEDLKQAMNDETQNL